MLLTTLLDPAEQTPTECARISAYMQDTNTRTLAHTCARDTAEYRRAVEEEAKLKRKAEPQEDNDEKPPKKVKNEAHDTK